MRTLTRYSQINNIDQCITKQVLHVYTMGNRFTSVWSMFVYNMHQLMMTNNGFSFLGFSNVCSMYKILRYKLSSNNQHKNVTFEIHV